MRQKKKRKIPPKGHAQDNMTVEQIMQLVAKKHARIIEYLKDK